MMRVVAIDGPAASGKSSTALAVATAIGFYHLDSGSLYRAMTRVALDAGCDPEHIDAEALLAVAEQRGLALRIEGVTFAPVLDGIPAEGLIRGPAVTAAVSAVSAVPEVRRWVDGRMRALAAEGYPLVVDGRDIGSVVFPDAEVKVFLVATPQVRAERRLMQRGEAADSDLVRAEAERLAERDRADSSRAVAPLRKAAGAIEIDGSTLSFEDQVDRIADAARAAFRMPAP
jgi:CMP/dCMP kinase